MKILLYTTGYLFGDKQTGGVKRQIELGRYICSKMNGDMCYFGSKDELLANRLNPTYQLNSPARKRSILPPEGATAFFNKKILLDIKKQKYDYVISFDVPPTVFLILFGMKNVVMLVRKDFIGYEKIVHRNSKLLYLKLVVDWISEAICMLGVKKIICQCDYDVQEMLDRHKLIKFCVKNKFFTQINNVNPEWVIEKSKQYSDCTTEEKFTIGFIGGFDDLRKGQDIFLRAAKRLINKYKDIFVVLVGGGEHLNKYKKEWSCSQIQFNGRESNPIISLSKMDLLVVPSLADSCPNTIVEALYNGVPVIGSNVGGIPELLDNEEALFELNDRSLENKIMELYLSREKLEELLRKETDRKRELTFDWAEAMVNRIIAI